MKKTNTITHAFLLLLAPMIGLCEEKAPTSSPKVEEILLDPVDTTRDRTVPIKVYRTKSSTPQPVVLFSHGLGGSREGNPYLGNHWAANGYVAVFLQHAGSDESVWRNAKIGERMNALRRGASARSSIDRLSDVPFILDQLELWNSAEGHALQGTLDLEKIGLSGHSFGAVTTLGMAGRKFPVPKSAYDERIDAFLPMSPNVGKGLSAKEQFGHLKVPVFCMTGTEDGSPLEPDFDPAERRKVYAAMPDGDKYQLVLEGAEHSAFSGGRGRGHSRNPAHHPIILELSTKYWDAYLRDDSAAKAWLQSEAPSKIKGMTSEDVWEWK